MQPDLFPDLYRAIVLPVNGTTPIARAASQSGAIQAQKTVGVKVRRILEALEHGALSRQQLSDVTGIRINSICSCLAHLIKRGFVTNAGKRTQVWESGETQQETFTIRRDATRKEGDGTSHVVPDGLSRGEH